MHNAVLFMNTIIHLLLKLRYLYSFSDGSNFNIYKLRKKYTKSSLEICYIREIIFSYF